MKSLRFQAILGLFLFVAASAFGQISAVEKLMSMGNRPAIRTQFLKTKPGYVEDLWSAFLKEEFKMKPKWVKKEKEWQTLDVKNSGMTGDVPVDFYAKIEEDEADATFTLWVDLDADDFVSKSSQPEAYRTAEELVARFSRRVASQQKQDRIEAEEKKLRGLESDLKKLQRENEKLKKDIEDWKKKILKAEEELKTNEADQIRKTGDIDLQQKALERAQTEN